MSAGSLCPPGHPLHRTTGCPQPHVSRQPLPPRLAMPSLGRLLPRVHAADSVTPAPVQIPSPLPSLVGQPEFPDTGWDCIKDLFGRDVLPITQPSGALCGTAGGGAGE
uniref:Uncharacterized protein n=1 Tax=Oncorhynchus tshawytscha TaxID=74940 RepID=A0A8C8HIN4_ONCTS